MLEVYGADSPALHELREWYLRQCKEMGQAELGDLACSYDFYADGQAVTPAARLLYRYREQLLEQFPDPYACPASGPSYQAWFKDNSGLLKDASSEEDVVNILQQELYAIQHSITWRIFRKLSLAYRRLGVRLGLHRFVSRLSR